MNFAFSLFSHLSDDLQQVLNCHSNMPKSPRKEIGWLGGAIQDEQNVCHPATSQVLWKVFAVSFGQCQKQMDGLIEFGNVFFLYVCVLCVAHQIVDKKHQKVLFLGRLALLRWICAVQCRLFAAAVSNETCNEFVLLPWSWASKIRNVFAIILRLNLWVFSPL